VIALIRYQLSLLIRSHRWIPPAVLFVAGVAGLASGGPALDHGVGLSQGLAWSALILVPVEAWLTRAMLTAEPAAARACVAAIRGPRRAQLAALIAATVVGVAFGLLGVAWELLRLGVPRSASNNSILVGATFSDVGAGLAAALVCLLVGSAIGALFNPPLIRRPAAAMLCTTGAVVLALAWSGSPANAEVRSVGYGAQEKTWPTGLALFAAIALITAAWAVSAQVAARRQA
jgi:hypothetical protein